MPTRDTTDFLAGVIEGFYGPPWTQAERHELFDWMARWGLNSYFYCPKDDLKHRVVWRELYTPGEEQTLREVIQSCRHREINFIYGLGPGLDIRYTGEVDLEHLRNRFQQIVNLGGQHFALLFDDIPGRLDPADLAQWGSLASAQCHVANTMCAWTRERSADARFLFCPTPYCGRMMEREHGGKGYLETIGRDLLPEIDVLWTGPEIISREITVAHIESLQRLLRRKPVIWDNLHANDYDGRRFYCGPYSGRPPELRNVVRGLLSNPNNEFPLNYVPLRTLAAFVHQRGDWDARQAYLSAMKEWLPHFATVVREVTYENLVLLGDCFYLPHEEGPEAETLYSAFASLLESRPEKWEGRTDVFRQRATRLRELCATLTALRNRPLFYALSRRIWDLREELDLLDRYVEVKCAHPDADVQSDFHLPGTYRGGMVARLQRLLMQRADGSMVPTEGADVAFY